MAEKCPCGSGRAYKDCCGPYISGKVAAPTAEALMRSRYAAYAKHEIDYLMDTILEDRSGKPDPESTRRWAEESEWLGLEIISTEAGGPADERGMVEFIARYRQEGRDQEHHEVSQFVRRNGRWFFKSGRVLTDTVVRSAPKVGRNEPCPCGSGKKYKHCCGK
jgi:SEC-C motif-containing protein